MDRVLDGNFLKRLGALVRELEYLKRDWLRKSPGEVCEEPLKQSLFGSVSAADISEEMIEESKRHLFRPLGDL